ncbi:hypothetical protein [Paenibacillus sp. O199]|uniref:hypothetical protein n=1 Tax=Paenibacillus sp. O199 TaxID=1643925 RepID=UPI0007BEBA49|nr:hypothetical protein [Paenibacillus sp. O199]
MYSNQKYVELMTNETEVQSKLLEVMEKYENDKWWISDNTDYLAYKQFQEDTMLVESTALQKATEALLGRDITFLDLRLNFKDIKNEVIEKYQEKNGAKEEGLH